MHEETAQLGGFFASSDGNAFGAPYRHEVRKDLVLEAIWAHAKNVAKKEQEEKRRQRDAEEDARTNELRRYYLNLTLANDDDLDLPLAA